jgi:small subunit ribosomal protein S15
MKQKKNSTINSLAVHDKDVGSSEVQIGLLTDKITRLAEHFKTSKKDKHSKTGLTKSVNRRKKLLAYLKRKNPESYTKVLKQLNLRK